MGFFGFHPQPFPPPNPGGPCRFPWQRHAWEGPVWGKTRFYCKKNWSEATGKASWDRGSVVRCEHRLSARQSMEQYLTCMEDFSWLDTIKCAAVYVLTCLILRTNLRGRALLLPVLQVRRPALLFSHSVVSDSLQPHELQHARLPCPSLSPRACSNSCPLSWWCYPTISSSVVPFSSCLQSFQISGSFLMSWFFTSGGQSIGASASASVLPMNIQGWFPLGLTGLISLRSKGLSRVFSNTTVQKHQFFGAQVFIVQLSHPYMTTVKTIALTRQTFVVRVMSLLFNMLCRLVIAFLPTRKCLLISWL